MKAGQLQTKIKQHCKSQDWDYTKIMVASPSGFPDCVIVTDKQVYFIEVKVGKDRQSDLQKWKQEQINKHGNYYYIVHTFEDFLGIVR